MLGELEPISRAFLDDDGYDDNTEETTAENCEWEWKIDYAIPEMIDVFLLIDNILLKEFVLQTMVHGLTPYCIYGKNMLRMYKLPETEVHICIADKYPESVAGEFTEELKPWLKAAESVTCVTLTTFVFYLNTDHVEESPCFIRALHTDVTTDSQKLDIKILPTPNFIRGLCAGILSWRQFMNLSGSLYCCYLDSKTIDSTNTVDITKLFADLNIPCRPYKTIYKQQDNLFL